MICVIFVIFTMCIFVDLVPINIKSISQQFIYDDTNILNKVCDKNDVALYIPYSHVVDTEGGTIVGLNYISRLLLSTENFSCKLVNGYSGYQPDKQIEYIDSFRKQKIKEIKEFDMV